VLNLSFHLLLARYNETPGYSYATPNSHARPRNFCTEVSLEVAGKGGIRFFASREIAARFLRLLHVHSGVEFRKEG
jgi:hypothetical protein